MSESNDFQMPTPAPELKSLDFLVGTWTLTGSTVAGPMGPAGAVTGTETYAWMEGGFFLVHHWDGAFEMGGVRVADVGHEFYDYDPASGNYRSHFFNNLGPWDAEGSKYEGGFDGAALVITGPARITRVPNADGTITVDSDVSDGAGGWVPLMRTTLTRSR